MTLLGELRRRSHREVLASVVVLGGLATFVVLVYLVLVVGVGALVGHTSSPPLGLSVLATAVVALAFDPVQNRLESLRHPRGPPRPTLALRRAAAVHRNHRRVLPRGGGAGAHGTGARRRHRRRAGPGLGRGGRPVRVGRHLATPDLGVPGRPGGGHPPARGPPGRRAAGRAGRQRASRRPAHLGRGATLRRSGEPGRARPPGRQVACAARAPAGRAVRASRGATRLARASGRRARRRTPAPRTGHPRRRAAAPGRPRGEPKARRHAGRALTGAGPGAPRSPGRGS